MARMRKLAAAGLLSLPCLLGPTIGQASDLEHGMAGSFNLPVASMKERLSETVTMQQYDFSCGAAVVSTVLTHHYGRPTAEDAVFKSMYESGDQAKIQKEGFSLLDMKNYFERIGMKADGFELTIDEIAKVGVPVIALIDLRGYKHFVLVKGVDGRRVLLGDPALGMTAMERDQFDEIRKKIVLLVRSEAKTGRKHFNLTKEWGIKPGAPVGSAAARDAIGPTLLETTFDSIDSF